jgi:predicted ATPase
MTMRLHRLEIHNYKSLRNVAIEPTPLSVFVGPNAAGKTNLADALDFLGHVYAWGLEKAVAYKGGYDNICYRDRSRTKQPISLEVLVELPWNPIEILRLGGGIKEVVWDSLRFDHLFEFKPKTQGIQAPFAVWREELTVAHRDHRGGAPVMFRHIGRKRREVEVKDEILTDEEEFDITKRGGWWGTMLQEVLERDLQGGTLDSGLLLPRFQALGWQTDFEMLMGSLRVFQLNPRCCREPGISTPHPELDRNGQNLPVALDHLKKEYPAEYALVLETARRVMPTLEEIETDWTHTRSLALFIRERGVRHPWTSDEVSDGTIQTIALLVAVFDPRTPLVVIEEPENSVHPWALRNLVEAFRIASEKKQIMLTTHSPILIDQLKPEEVWVVRKPGTETKIDPLLSLDPSLKESWGQGKFTLSEYLDSGAVPEAVPAANS